MNTHLRIVSLPVLVAALVASLLGFRPALLRANSAAIERAPAVWGAPRPGGKTALAVGHETLRFDCVEEAGGKSGSCRFEARYVVLNPTDTAQTAVGAFYGARSGDVAILVDGASVARELSEAERTAIDRVAWESVSGGSGPGETNETPYWRRGLTQTGFLLTVEAGGRRTMTVTGITRPMSHDRSRGWMLAPYVSRHVALHSGHDGRRLELDYHLAPIRSWASVGAIDVEVRYPARWTLSGNVFAHPDPASYAGVHDPRWAETQEGGANVARATLHADDGARLALTFDTPPSTVHHGGPLLGFGGTLKQDTGFAMRFGYELAAPGWLLHSLNIDTDFRNWVVIAPVTEALSPFFLLIPSFGLGVGVPVKLAPEVDVGVRLQGSVGWGPLSFVTSVDLFPAHDPGDPRFYQVYLYGQLSF